MVSTDSTTELRIIPTEPLTGVAPGQTAVVYVGTRVLGQCTIDRTVSRGSRHRRLSTAAADA